MFSDYQQYPQCYPQNLDAALVLNNKCGAVAKGAMAVADTAQAMVLTEFGKPLEAKSFALPEPGPGALIARVTAAGICGSDLEIADGHDPRVRLPMILGHEGIGVIEALGSEKCDMFGQPLAVGDRIVWHRAVACGRCVYCAVKRESSLCLHRQVYGISIPCGEPPYLNGCYAQYLYVRPESEIIRLQREEGALADEHLVAATCSGATAAHAIELCDIHIGDTVAIIGPGPLGIWAAALAFERGARQVIMMGTQRSIQRVKLAESFGCIGVNVNATTEEERRGIVGELTHSLGADIVIDSAGTAATVREALGLAARGGVVAIPGVAVPVGEMPILPYEEIAIRNIRLQGVWVSDARHMWEAISLAQSRRYPLDKLVTHTFPLSQANEALDTLRRREAIKAVLIPD